MNRNKQVLKYCPNFYKIINYDYPEDDPLTMNLIKVYEDYIFHIDLGNLEDIRTVSTIDKILARYIDDCIFRKEMKYELLQVRVKKNCDNILKAMVDAIISIFHRYEEGTTRRIYVSRWI